MSPQYPLDVRGDIITNGWVRINGNGTGIYWPNAAVGLYADTTPWVKGYNNCGLFMGNGRIASEAGLSLGYSGAAPPTGGAVIAGAVSIGTSSAPTNGSILEVLGPNVSTVATANQIVVCEQSNNAGYRLCLGYGNFAAQGWSGSISALVGNAGGPLILNGNGGRVGIGTTNPYTLLSVGLVSPGSGSGLDGNVTLSAATLAVYGTALNGPSITWNILTNGGYANTAMGAIQATMGSDSNYRLNFMAGIWNNNASAGNVTLCIVGNGMVGIGTTTPSYQLTVAGSMNTTGKANVFGWASGPLAGAQNTDANIMFYNASSTNWAGIGCDTSGNCWWRTGTSGTQNPQFTFSNSGNVGIGTTAPSYVLHVNPDSAGKPGTSTWLVASDARTKQAVQEMEEDSLALLRQLRWIRFQYNGLANLPFGMDCMGLEAQAVQAVIPEAVGSVRAKLRDEDAEETDLLHLNYHAIYTHMARAIQQLDRKVRDLEAQLKK
jgi:hypothetical protein